VKERTLLWNHGTVRVSIPKDAKWGSFEDESVDLHFLQFAPFVKGGRVNVFVHNATDTMIGKRITASAELWKKTLEDGRSYLYVDLRPSSESKDPTHRMVVVSGPTTEESAFKTPAPLVGYVLFMAPDAKIVEHTPPARKDSKDPQLDRLTSAGWKIAREDATTVSLTKGDGVQQKTMTHHRPKNKK